MDAQTNPTTDAKKSRYETLDERMMKMQITFGNASLPTIFPVMLTVGYTEARIASLKAKLDSLVELQQSRTKEYAEQLDETEKFDKKHDEINAVYSTHRSLLRILFKGNTLQTNMLMLNSAVPTAYSAWDKMVDNFYSQITTSPDLLVKAQTVGITAVVIADQKKALVDLKDIKKSQRREIAEAIAATEARDNAFDELYPLYSEYVEYAKVLLTDNQALKALGVTVK